MTPEDHEQIDYGVVSEISKWKKLSFLDLWYIDPTLLIPIDIEKQHNHDSSLKNQFMKSSRGKHNSVMFVFW